MFVFAANITFAQAPKKHLQPQTLRLKEQPLKMPGKGNPKAGKGTTKGTLAADMDRLVKATGSAKLVTVKAYTPFGYYY